MSNYKIERYYLLDLLIRENSSGTLVAVEAFKDVPFDIKRIFYISGTAEDSVRGNHANINSKFAFISVAGECCIELYDGEKSIEYRLDQPNKMLFVDKMIWKTMKNFSEGNILLVISDCFYDKDEYIYDFNEYKKIAGK